MLTINEPITIASIQNIKFNELHITGGNEGKLNAVISFIVTNENGEIVDTKIVRIDVNDFNDFWTKFNTGIFIYEQLSKVGVKQAIDASVEADFVNVVAMNPPSMPTQ